MPDLDRILHFLDRKVGDELESYRSEFGSFRGSDSISDKAVRLHDFLGRIETVDVRHYLNGDLELSEEMSGRRAQSYLSNGIPGGWMKNDRLGGYDRQFFWYRAGKLRFRIDTARVPKAIGYSTERFVFSGNLEVSGKEEAENNFQELLSKETYQY